MKESTHLYWAFDRPHLLIGLNTGVALCGERGILKSRLTCISSAVTCRSCQKTKLAHKKSLSYTGTSKPPQKEESKSDVRRSTRDSRTPARVRPVGKKNKRK